MRFAFVYLGILAMCVLALGQPRDAPTAGGIQPGDQILIRPIKVEQRYAALFDLDLTVDDDGTVSIPTFDLKLDVRSMQPEDAEVIIRSTLREASDLTRLDLDIFATRDNLPLPGQHCVTVSGHVHRTGPVALEPGMTLAEAVEVVGGITPSGQPRRVRLYREGTVQVCNLATPAQANRRLAPNDTIDVPGRFRIGL